MRFAFSDEQIALRDAVRDLLAKECPPAAVRAAWSNDSGRCPSAWTALTDMGVLTAQSSRAPLRLAFPATLASRWMPGLFPDRPS